MLHGRTFQCMYDHCDYMQSLLESNEIITTFLHIHLTLNFMMHMIHVITTIMFACAA